MCTSPTLIKNPNYGYKGKYAFMKDTVSTYIPVPCGHCSECVAVRQLSLVQRCVMESQFGYPFFATLTYNQESLPIYECSDGYKIRYAMLSDVVNMIKRLRKDNALGRLFRYLAVSELGSKRARPHFHVLFFVQKFPEDTVYTPINLEHLLFPTVLRYWSRNYGSRRSPDFKPLCTYVRKYSCGKLKSTYDLHYVSPSTLDGCTLDVAFYVTKYMLKPSDKASRLQQALKLNLSPEEYDQVWSKVKPRWFSSLNFGFGVYGLQSKKLSLQERLSILEDTDSFKYVRSSIDRSLSSSDRPKFFNPENGRSFPLSRYWMRFGNLYTEQDAIKFHFLNPDWREDNVIFDERPLDNKLLSDERHLRHLQQIENNQENFNLLFD